MWLTDYEGAIVEDKIKSGLTGELRWEWAKLTTKPHSVAEQLRVLRDMGHALEDLDKKDAGSKPNSKGAKRKDSKGKPDRRGGRQNAKPAGKQKGSQNQKGNPG